MSIVTIVLRLVLLVVMTLVFMALFQYGPEGFRAGLDKEIRWLTRQPAATPAGEAPGEEPPPPHIDTPAPGA